MTAPPPYDYSVMATDRIRSSSTLHRELTRSDLYISARLLGEPRIVSEMLRALSQRWREMAFKESLLATGTSRSGAFEHCAAELDHVIDSWCNATCEDEFDGGVRCSLVAQVPFGPSPEGRK